MRNIAQKMTRGQALLNEAIENNATVTFFTDFLGIPQQTIFKITEGKRLPSIEEKLFGACEFLKMIHDDRKRSALLLLLQEIEHRNSRDCPDFYEINHYADKHGI